MIKSAINGPDPSHPPAPGGGVCRASGAPVITRRPAPSSEGGHGKSPGRMPAGHLEILTIYISCRDDGFGKPWNSGPDIVPHHSGEGNYRPGYVRPVALARCL